MLGSPQEQDLLSPEDFETPLLKYQLFGFKVFGYMFSSQQSFLWLHHIRGVIFSASFVIFNIMQYIDLALIWGELDIMMMNMSTTIQFTTLIFRMYMFYTNRSKFVRVVKHVVFNVREVMEKGTPQEQIIMNENVSYIKQLAKTFSFMAILTGHSLMVYTLVHDLVFNPDKEPTPILRAWFPIQNKYVAYVIQVYMVCLGEILVPCWHTFVVGLMTYAIASLIILNYRLEHLSQYASRRMGRRYKRCLGFIDEREQLDFTKEEVFKKVVVKHNSILLFVHDVEDLIGSSVFIDFVVYSGLLCALLYQTSKATDSIQIFIGICYILTMIVMQWMYYWHANEISEYIYQLSGSIYMGDWYTFPLRLKKLVLLFLTSNTPRFQCKALLIVMSLNMFITILRAAYSYFTLLQQL